MFNTVFNERLQDKGRDLQIHKFAGNITVEYKFPRKTNILYGQISVHLLQFFLQMCDWEFFQIITEQIRHADGDFLNLGDIMDISERLYNIQGIVEEMMIDLKLKHLIPHFLFVELNLIVLLKAAHKALIELVKAGDQFAQFFVGTADRQIDGSFTLVRNGYCFGRI